jgi:hypothetical protein
MSYPGKIQAKTHLPVDQLVDPVISQSSRRLGKSLN